MKNNCCLFDSLLKNGVFLFGISCYFRNIDVFLLRKLGKWWHHQVCILNGKILNKEYLWKYRALSIQKKKSPFQIFRIFAGRLEHVQPLPRIQGHMLCNTGHAGWNFVVFENGRRFEHFRGFRTGRLWNSKLYHSR